MEKDIDDNATASVTRLEFQYTENLTKKSSKIGQKFRSYF
jgi:hypothetical protein